MKLFSCVCQQVVYFESVSCTRCGRTLAFLPDRGVVAPLARVDGATAGATIWRPDGEDGPRHRLCRNSWEHEVCNWAFPAGDDEEYCRACRLNQTIPNLADPGAKAAWHRLELAKRRLLYTLLDLNLPVESKKEDPARGLAFSFLKDDPGAPRVFTGHNDGLVTINVAEADDPFREKMRVQMGETYRTVLGHFRHEIGHYYELRLVDGTPRVDAFRGAFGDETQDYQAALDRHYREGAPADWPQRFVSQYASMHPYEDFAETWAHYLHLVETLDTARSYGLALRPRPMGGPPLTDL